MLCHISVAPLQKVTSPASYEPIRKNAVHSREGSEGDGTEWFDEDFGLSKTRREAEVLRLQQLKIELEIEQLQAQQEQVPYFYLREIPNKPPPPYTPPGKTPTPAEKPPPAPTSAPEITRNIRNFARAAYRALKRGEPAAKPETEDPFVMSLWCLAEELVAETCTIPEEPKTASPWERVPPPLTTWRAALRPSTEEAVVETVLNEALVLYGLRQRVGQESLIVRWSRKKRDHVDELLVWESQAEEADWTRFDDETLQVKNEVFDGLMDSLLDETASVFSEILKKKALLKDS